MAQGRKTTLEPKAETPKVEKPKVQKAKDNTVRLIIRRVGADELGNLLYKEQRWTGVIQEYKQLLGMGYPRNGRGGSFMVYSDFVIVSEDNIPDGCPTEKQFNEERAKRDEAFNKLYNKG